MIRTMTLQDAEGIKIRETTTMKAGRKWGPGDVVAFPKVGDDVCIWEGEHCWDYKVIDVEKTYHYSAIGSFLEETCEDVIVTIAPKTLA